MGLADQIISGEQRFDLSGYDPSTLEDIGATVASFLMPADFLLTLGTGGLASIPAKALAKRTVAQLVKSGIKGQVAKRVAQSGVTRAVQGASVLGVYSGAQSALGQQAEFGEIDLGEVTKAALRGTVAGAIAGGAGGAIAGRFAAKAAAAAKIAGQTAVKIRPLEKAVEVAGEVVAFGTAVPALEMRLPTAQDYIHAAGVILGLRAVHATASTGMKALRKSIATEIKTVVETRGIPIEQAVEIVGADIFTRSMPEVPAAIPIPGVKKPLVVRVGGQEITVAEYRALRDRSPLNQEDVLRLTIRNEQALLQEATARGDKESALRHEQVLDETSDRLVRIQAERATEVPEPPVEPPKPGVRPEPLIEPETALEVIIPPEVQSVRDVFSKQESDMRASNKADPKKVYSELKRKLVDVRANVRQKLLKEGGDEGRQAVVKFDTATGSASWAKLEYFRAEKEIFRLAPPERSNRCSPLII
ncbi:unnamed protein product [marine sediment metagenome]|uniref:Uncharacterized protein n=1 Tax=marine sediment metagenome TaxID=412755 RepID=X0ZUG4_9ZZZZ